MYFSQFVTDCTDCLWAKINFPPVQYFDLKSLKSLFDGLITVSGLLLVIDDDFKNTLGILLLPQPLEEK